MNSMISLEFFPSPPPGNEISVCYLKGTAYTNESVDNNILNRLLRNHPDIVINREQVIRGRQTEDVQSLFLPGNEILPKRLIRIYFENGFMESLQTAADLHNSYESKFITIPAYYLLKTIKYFQNMQYIMKPHLKDVGSNLIHHFSETRSWLKSPIRCLSWHPNTMRLAVVTIDDCIRVYSDNEKHFVPMLKGRNQTNISCIAWRPFAAFDIAVGCENGVLLWKIDPMSVVSRPSIANAVMFKQKMVSSVAWNRSGTLLASASVINGTFLVWDCELEQNAPVYCCRTGVSLLLWAPESHYLCAIGTNSMYRIYDTTDWSNKQWDFPKGVIQSACWTPCGNHLLFANTEEPIVYSLNMSFAIGPEKSTCTPQLGPVCIVDTTKLSARDGTTFGGIVQCLRISPNGCFLAIMFKDTSLIALCKINVHIAVINITPSVLLKGYSNEYPTSIEFQENMTTEDSSDVVLTIAWSSTRIQQFPIKLE